MTNDQIIKHITRIRTKNNKNWMNLLKLALKSDPIRAKKILLKITENDREITHFTGRLH